MITIRCDKCEKALTFPDSMAGEKTACPACGDVNTIPTPAHVAGASSASGGVEDRATRLGLPPDHGPEQTVLRLRPVMFRARPFAFLGLALWLLAGVVGGITFLVTAQMLFAVLLLAAAVPAGVVLVVWKIRTLFCSVEITNKRTIETRGLLSKATSEVMHDNIRNFQIHQSFIDRIFNVGRIGISSSGQDGIEIQVKDLPQPFRIRQVIDTYRPM